MNPSSTVNGFSERVCLRSARLFLNGPLKRFGFRSQRFERFDSMQEYTKDRTAQTDEYVNLFKPFCSFAGKTVLEVGCNRGYMLDAFLRRGAFTPIGADIDDTALRVGAVQFPGIHFVHSTPKAIPLPNESVNAAYTIDTVEHLIHVRDVFADVYRILKPGGLFLIHFSPWLAPYGSHLEDIIPYPWPHLVFSMDTLLNVAAYLYDSPEYKTAAYFYDIETGQKKPNPYVDRERWANFLNRITIAHFRKVIQSLPFERVHYEQIGFGGRKYRVGKYLSGLAQVRPLDEFFVKAIFCALKKPN